MLTVKFFRYFCMFKNFHISLRKVQSLERFAILKSIVIGDMKSHIF